MSIIGWIILGLVAGFIASKIVNKQGEGFFLDIVGALEALSSPRSAQAALGASMSTAWS
jgi:uncharacterized membrane protein YeaQ/YmgE (transglycosylase-associated protein family)